MKGELDDRLIERYVSGNETDEDRIAIEEWAGLSRDNAAFLADLKKISQDIDMLSAMKRIDSMSALKETRTGTSAKTRKGRYRIGKDPYGMEKCCGRNNSPCLAPVRIPDVGSGSRTVCRMDRSRFALWGNFFISVAGQYCRTIEQSQQTDISDSV